MDLYGFIVFENLVHKNERVVFFEALVCLTIFTSLVQQHSASRRTPNNTSFGHESLARKHYEP